MKSSIHGTDTPRHISHLIPFPHFFISPPFFSIPAFPSFFPPLGQERSLVATSPRVCRRDELHI